VQSGHGLLLVVVGRDVLLHVSVVQTGVDVLGFLGLANSYLVAGIVAAGFLEHLVLISTEDGGLGGEGLGQNQRMGAGRNIDGSHGVPLSGALPLFFVSKVFALRCDYMIHHANS